MKNFVSQRHSIQFEISVLVLLLTTGLVSAATSHVKSKMPNSSSYAIAVPVGKTVPESQLSVDGIPVGKEEFGSSPSSSKGIKSMQEKAGEISENWHSGRNRLDTITEFGKFALAAVTQDFRLISTVFSSIHTLLAVFCIKSETKPKRRPLSMVISRQQIKTRFETEQILLSTFTSLLSSLSGVFASHLSSKLGIPNKEVVSIRGALIEVYLAVIKHFVNFEFSLIQPIIRDMMKLVADEVRPGQCLLYMSDLIHQVLASNLFREKTISSSATFFSLSEFLTSVNKAFNGRLEKEEKLTVEEAAKIREVLIEAHRKAIQRLVGDESFNVSHVIEWMRVLMADTMQTHKCPDFIAAFIRAVANANLYSIQSQNGVSNERRFYLLVHSLNSELKGRLLDSPPWTDEQVQNIRLALIYSLSTLLTMLQSNGYSFCARFLIFAIQFEMWKTQIQTLFIGFLFLLFVKWCKVF